MNLLIFFVFLCSVLSLPWDKEQLLFNKLRALDPGARSKVLDDICNLPHYRWFYEGGSDLFSMAKVLYLAGLKRGGDMNLAKSIIRHPTLLNEIRNTGVYRFGFTENIGEEALENTLEAWANEKQYFSEIASDLYDYGLRFEYTRDNAPIFLGPMCDILYQNDQIDILKDFVSKFDYIGLILERINFDTYKFILSASNAVDYNHKYGLKKNGLITLRDLYLYMNQSKKNQKEKLKFFIDFLMKHSLDFLNAGNKKDSISVISDTIQYCLVQNYDLPMDIFKSHTFDSMIGPIFIEVIPVRKEKLSKIDWESNNDQIRRGYMMNKNQFQLIMNFLRDDDIEYDHIRSKIFSFIQAILLADDHQVASKALVVFEDFLEIMIKQVDKGKLNFHSLKELVGNVKLKEALEGNDRGSKLLQQAIDLIKKKEASTLVLF